MLEEIINHYKHPRHKKILVDWTHKAEADNPMCGDDIIMYIKCNNDIIIQASFEGSGCSISQGCADIMCERIIGLNKNDLNNLNFDLFDLEELPISKSRHKCATLSLNALKGIK